MILRKAFFLFMIVLSFKMTAQSFEWTSAGMPNYGRQIRCIYTDTLNDFLYVSGEILNSPTNFSNNFICKYDGVSWTTLGTFDSQVLSLTTYNGDLIAAGLFSSINGVSIFSIARFDGSTWQSLGNFDLEVTKLKTINNDLYAMGYFNSVDGLSIKRIAKWNGTVWTDVYNFSADTMEGHVNDVIIYKGNTYVCGNFVNSTLGINHLAVYKAGVWQNVGTGINGSWNDLTKMAIYQNELYLLGLILKPANTGNGIQKWNDTLWTEVGDGVQGFSNEYGNPSTIIMDGLVHNNELIVVGSFGYAGHIPAYCAAKWDGLKWCGLATNNLLSNKVLSTNFYNDTLYLGISNDTLNGVFTNRIIKYTAGNYVDTCSVEFTWIESLSLNNVISIYPNPATDQISVEIGKVNTKKVSAEIKNVLGQTIKKIDEDIQEGKSKIEIDINGIPNGIYLIQLQNGDKISCKKFIKQ
jgi:hypothetical protein